MRADDEIIPRRGTEKLAEALGIADRVVWIDGMEHNTFISGFPGVGATASSTFSPKICRPA